jgi:acetyl esterase/lipase
MKWIIPAAVAVTGWAQSTAPRQAPARPLPVPETVSPILREAIAPPWGGIAVPRTADEWRKLARQRDDDRARQVPELCARFGVKVGETRMAGVRVYRVTPEAIAPENRSRVLMHLHGGAYVFFGGVSATIEAILMAGHGKIEVLSVDYRMPPDAPFPAALDDSVAVWRELTRRYPPKNAGMFGTSAGGGLTLATVLELKKRKLPLPGALMAGTPWSDLTKTGDTYFTNEMVDNVLGTNDGMLEGAARLYANGRDSRDPLLSPVYGDLSGFPPTILLSGTRDLFLSNTVRVHQKLRAAGVPADLWVFEGQSHGQYMIVNRAPESAEAFRQVAEFFNVHLGR